MPKLIDKDEKKRNIAIAAIDLFAEHGIAKTSVDEIAKEARVGKGTVYLYFKTKEEIIIEIWEHVHEMLDKDTGRRFETTNSYEEKLRMFFDFSIIESQPDLMHKLIEIYKMNIAIILAGDNAALKQNFKEHMFDDGMVIKTLLDEGIKAGEFKAVDTALIAKMLYFSREGILVCGFGSERSIDDIKEDLDEQLDYILGIIRKEK